MPYESVVRHVFRVRLSRSDQSAVDPKREEAFFFPHVIQ